jgi:hypothetical protein
MNDTRTRRSYDRCTQRHVEGAAMSRFADSSPGFFEELDRRVSAGLEVALLWSRSASKLVVSVVDTMTGERFELPVGREEALEAFNHPFAYAAGHGVAWGASGWGLESRG